MRRAGAGSFVKLKGNRMKVRAASRCCSCWRRRSKWRCSHPPQLPPISWTCPMHPDVLERKKGTCPLCRMELVPVRMAMIWTCPVHGVIEQDTPGKCRICGARSRSEPLALSRSRAPAIPRSTQIDPGPLHRRQPTDGEIHAAPARRPQPEAWRSFLHGAGQLASHRRHVSGGRALPVVCLR